MYNFNHFLFKKIMLAISFIFTIVILSACSSSPSDKLKEYLGEIGWECSGTVCEFVTVIDDDISDVDLQGSERNSRTIKYDSSIAKFTISRTLEFSGLLLPSSELPSSEYITRDTVYDLDIFLISGQANMYMSQTYLFIVDGISFTSEAETSYNVYNGNYQCDKSGDLDNICRNSKRRLEFEWEVLVILIQRAGLSIDDFRS